MKCKIGEAIEKIENLIDKPAIKASADTVAELEIVKGFLNSAREIKMSKIQSDTSPESTKFKKGNNNEYDSELDTSIANKLSSMYKDIEVIYLNGQNEMRSVLEELGGDIALFQLSKKRKDEFENKLRKARPELDNTSLDKVLSSIENFSETESNGNDKLMKKLELLALHWTIKGNLILPEDGSKVIQALKIAEKNKFDPFSYNNPNDITESFAKVEDKVKPLDPDDYIGKGYSNRRELPEGVVVYDVDNTDTGREVSRAMIDTHFGKDANPWCLLARKNGGIEFSSTYWYNTYPGKKKIAFHNGKLVAFYGGDMWWDRLDNSNSGIPITKSGSFIEGESKVKARFLVNEELKEVKPYSSPFSSDSAVVYEKGENTPGKSYHGWNKDKVKVIEIFPNGNTTEWHPNGKIKTSKIKKESSDGFSIKSYYESGALEKEQLDGFLGDSTAYYENGSIKEVYKKIVDSSGLKFLSIEYDKDGYVYNARYPNRVRVSNNNMEFLGDYSSIEDGVKVLTSTIGKLSNNPAKRMQRIHKDGTFVYYYDKYKKDKEFLVERVVTPDGTETLYDKKGRITKVTDSEGKVTTNEYKDGLVAKVRDFIGFQEENDIIKGAAVISKNKILIDIENRSTDTLAHEYAHFYIAAFRDTSIVKEAIKKWGNEENLVQAIGEQVVKQKGEVYNWWKQFSKWVKNLFGSLNKATKEELVQLLTDAFLTNMDISADTTKDTPKQKGSIMSKLDKIQKEIGALFPVSDDIEQVLESMSEEQIDTLIEQLKCEG